MLGYARRRSRPSRQVPEETIGMDRLGSGIDSQRNPSLESGSNKLTTVATLYVRQTKVYRYPNTVLAVTR